MDKPSITCLVRSSTGHECGRPAKGDQQVRRTPRGIEIHYDCGVHAFHLPLAGMLDCRPCDCGT